MKRSVALIGLSHDHHHGLVHVRHIREGVKLHVERGRITSYIVWFFEIHLAGHFRQEEEEIFPLIDAAHPLRLQAVAEHQELISLVSSFTGNIHDTPVGLYAHVLDAHIRFEERELFKYLQQYCSDDLAKLGNSAARSAPGIHKPWLDQFWLE